MSENALKECKVKHAAEIAAIRAEFVEFLRNGELPPKTLDSIALYIHICKSGDGPERKPLPAGAFFDCIVSDGIYEDLDYWDNPKKSAALTVCPNCGGEGYYAPTAAPAPAVRLKPNKGRVRGV